MSAYQQWVAFCTIVVREVRRFTRIWPQTLLPPVITMSLYFVIFGNLVGQRIGQMGGFDYMQFIVPGLIMMAVVQNSYSNVVSSFFSAKFQLSVEEMLVSPMPAHVILTGFIVGGMTRGVLVGLIVSLVSLFFTDLSIQHLWIVVLVVIMTSALFSLGGFLNATFARNFDDISIIPNFVLTPLTYLGGVFYSLDLLPDFWRHVTLINPLVYMINAFRYGVLGVSDVNVYASLGAICVFVVVFYVLCLWLLKRGTGIRS